MSLTEISTRVAIVACLALIALLVVVRRKPARNGAASPRDRTEWGPPPSWDSAESDPHEPGRKLALDTAGLGAIAIFGGIMVAIVVSLAVSWIVTNFSNRL